MGKEMNYSQYFQVTLAILDFLGSTAYYVSGNVQLGTVFGLYGLSSLAFAFL